MNARKLKAAFIHMSPVSCDDKDNPIGKGYVKSVIYSLTQSGKVKCEGDVYDLNDPHNHTQAPCRHIAFTGKEPPIEKPSGAPNEHAESIKEAFLKVLPVVAVVPGMNVVECSYITAFVYTRGRKGNIICTCILQDAGCPHSTLQVRIKYIRLKSEYDMEKGC